MRTSDSCNVYVKCPFFISLKGANIMCRSIPGTKFKIMFEKTGMLSSSEKAVEHLRHYCYEIQDINDPECCPLFAALWRLWEVKHND